MLDKIGYKPLPFVGNATAINSNNESGATNVAKSFGSFLSDAINNLNEQQNTVDGLNEQFVKGELSDVHQLTIASEKASLGLEFAVQVRNKAIEAYQEMMRMQI